MQSETGRIIHVLVGRGPGEHSCSKALLTLQIGALHLRSKKEASSATDRATQCESCPETAGPLAASMSRHLPLPACHAPRPAQLSMMLCAQIWNVHLPVNFDSLKTIQSPSRKGSTPHLASQLTGCTLTACTRRAKTGLPVPAKAIS